MSGEVTATPWKRERGVKNRWRVYVPAQPMTDGTRTEAERVVRTAYSKTEALEWGRERREKIIEHHKQQQRGDIGARRPKIMAFATLVESEWLPHLRVQVAQQQRKPSSVDAIESAVTIHVIPFIGTLPVDQITNAVMTRLMEAWIKGGYADPNGRPVTPTASPKTLNNRKTIVNAALKFAVERKHVPLMPCRIEVRHVETDEAEHYTPEVYERLIAAAGSLDPRIQVALMLAGDAGLRRGEILALCCDDLNVTTGEIMIRRSVFWRRASKGREMVETLPKGKLQRPVAATDRLVGSLRQLVGQRKGRVLLTDDGDQVSPKMLRVWAMHAEAKAGLPVTGRLHVLRHSHLTHLANAGATLLEIASQARHADLRVTQKYLHRGSGAARSAVKRLEASRVAVVSAPGVDSSE